MLFVDVMANWVSFLNYRHVLNPERAPFRRGNFAERAIGGTPHHTAIGPLPDKQTRQLSDSSKVICNRLFKQASSYSRRELYGM